MAGLTDCPNCGATANAPPHPGARISCRYCRHVFQLPGAASVASGGASTANAVGPIPQRGADPLSGLVVKGIWRSIASGHQLVVLPGRERILDWEPASGRYSIWHYDRTVSSG